MEAHAGQKPPRRFTVKEKMLKYPRWNRELSKMLLKSKYVPNMIIEDIERSMDELMRDFPHLVKIQSIGKTYQGHDIPIFTLADPTGTVPIKDRPAILLNGATHARELITIQMVFYSMFKLLHGHVHEDE